MTDPQAAAREIVRVTGGDIRLALPLGIGKPVTLVNALVQLACDEPSIRLKIFTALTLEVPSSGNDMQRRFLDPAKDRLFGAYPRLLYADLLRRGALPDNIEVSEFFLLAGQWLGVKRVQQDYVSVNYTQALDVLLARRPNVLAQLVADDGQAFSLSCNTDISADLFRLREEGAIDFIAAAETSPELPFLGGDGAVVEHDRFHLALTPEEPFELFSSVKRPVDLASHATGLHVSRLIEDGGTLQIGIGAIGDAVAHALLLRQDGTAREVQDDCPFAIGPSASGPFEHGLHAVTEMLVGGMLALFEGEVVKREVDGRAICAGFFVDTRDFYRKLRQMPRARRDRIAMMPVSFTNTLAGDEAAKRAARTRARFVNGAMKVSLLGDVMSDSLADGKVVSGVGGQFDFVQQAFALDDGRAIITVPATRRSGERLESNVVWSVDAVTVPRHMRDIVVTEYGIADLRGKSDAEVISGLVEIADSRFQKELIDGAKAAGKLPESYSLPAAASRNLPETVSDWLTPHRTLLPDFPFGSDFDTIERALLPALETLKRSAASTGGYLRLLRAAVLAPPHPDEAAAMKRMGFAVRPTSLSALALRGALRLTRQSSTMSG